MFWVTSDRHTFPLETRPRHLVDGIPRRTGRFTARERNIETNLPGEKAETANLSKRKKARWEVGTLALGSGDEQYSHAGVGSCSWGRYGPSIRYCARARARYPRSPLARGTVNYRAAFSLG